MTTYQYTNSAHTIVKATDANGHSLILDPANLPNGITPEPFAISEVSMRQFKAALILQGNTDSQDYLALVEGIINALTGLGGLLAKNDWLTASIVKITYPLVAVVKSQAGWTEQQLQDLFTLADTL